MNSNQQANPALAWLEQVPKHQRLALFRLYSRALEMARKAEEAEGDQKEAAQAGDQGAAIVKEEAASADNTIQSSSPL